MAKEKDLNDAFYETLKDVYYAEKQSVKASRKSAKDAKASELKSAFEEHAEVSSHQVERLEKIFEIIGQAARGKTSETMRGIVAEMEEDLKDFGGTPAGDAVLLACAQAIEHYDISRYGTLRTWAEQLGHQDAAKLIDDRSPSKNATDEKLSKLARTVNAQALAAA